MMMATVNIMLISFIARSDAGAKATRDPFILRSSRLYHQHHPPPFRYFCSTTFHRRRFPLLIPTFTFTDKEGTSAVVLALYKVLLNQVVNPQTRPPRLDQFSATSAIICAKLE